MKILVNLEFPGCGFATFGTFRIFEYETRQVNNNNNNNTKVRFLRACTNNKFNVPYYPPRVHCTTSLRES